MSAVNWPIDGNLGDMSRRLSFFKNLQRVTNRIHGASNIDEIILEMSEDICELFHADRLTIYLVSDDRHSIVSKVKTGLNTHKDIRLPISEQSVAGYVAVSGRSLNLRDVLPYQPFVANHVKPMDLLRNIKREFVERSLWLPWRRTPRAW
jgi:GAF domain-containing protein